MKKITVVKSIFSASATKEEKPAPAQKQKKALPEKKKKKKVGRPSKFEVEAKKEAERQADIALRQELLERQKKATVIIEDESEAPVRNIHDPNYVPRYPIFMMGQRVQQTHHGIVFKGTVDYDGIDTPWVLIRWDDGSRQYAAKGLLTIIQKKVYKNVLNKKRKAAERVSDSDLE